MSTAPQRASSAARRLARQEEAARVLCRALERHDVTRAALAAAAGVPEQRARDWADTEADRHLSLADACAAPHAVRVELAEHLAGPTHVVALLPTTDRTRLPADISAAGALVRGHAAVLDSLLAGLADGVLDPGERRHLRQRVRDHLRELAALEAALEQGDAELDALVERAKVARIGGAR